MLVTDDFEKADKAIAAGKIIAYPTEAVYGLGCNPFDNKALENLLNIKLRHAHKGFIVLIGSWSQLDELVLPFTVEQKLKLESTWPGAVTWVFPAKPNLSPYLIGKHNSIAIRMTAHPIASRLCRHNPIVSTSANISGMQAARSIKEIQEHFDKDIELILKGDLGNSCKPTPIYDLLTGVVYRQ